MPKPFLELTLDQFADLLVEFPWKRKVTEVHVHHTFRPNHADFAARPPIQSIEGMFRFHTKERGFSDIAQHITIDPAGMIWTGRNWNVAPASATGFNGNSAAGPFMFEMIGNFDTGNDRWEGAQRDAAIEVIARVQKLFGLQPEAFRFHNEMSSKSCPGTALKKPDVLAAVKKVHERLAAPRAARAGVFEGAASRQRATTERLLQLFDVNTGARAMPEETELPESSMNLREGEMSAGNLSVVRAGRDADTRELSPDDRALLRKHVINLRMGAFSSGGEFQTTQEDVVALFSEHLPKFLEERKKEGGKLKLVFFAHGGLNDEGESLKNARNRISFYTANKCYPIFFVWETGVKETLVDILREIVGLGGPRDLRVERAFLDKIGDFTDPGLEFAFRNGGLPMWTNMKLSAERAFLPKQGGTFLVQQLAAFWKLHSPDMEIHAIGHSAGCIFQTHFIDLLCQQSSNPPLEVQSVHFLAPAITIDLFQEKLAPLVGGRVKKLTEFTMLRDFELADSVGPYRKSLLYLVSRSFEDQSGTPILGLEESIRRDPDIMDFFGLRRKKTAKAEILFSVHEAGPSHSTIARKHGDFDNDRLTMSGVIRRILAIGDETPIVEFPETVSRNVLDAVTPKATPTTVAPAPISALSVASPVVRTGARRAVCVGIDEYDPPNALAGCVNDANDWAAALRSLGFQTSVIVNRQATWQAISDTLSDLVRASKPGDVVVFQYAGHGTRVEDLDGDEQGGSDSALCPVDFPAGGFLIDDDIRRTFQKLSDGVNLTCFFDCCHSGTITRLVAPTPAARAGKVRSRGLHATPEMQAAHKEFRMRLAAPAPRPRGAEEMKEVSFTACSDAQTAQEVDGHGEFTVRALGILRQGLAGLTNGSFYQKVLAAFGSGAETQTPQLDCSNPAKARALLAGMDGGSVEAAPGSAALESIVARLNDIDRRLTKLGV